MHQPSQNEYPQYYRPQNRSIYHRQIMIPIHRIQICTIPRILRAWQFPSEISPMVLDSATCGIAITAMTRRQHREDLARVDPELFRTQHRYIRAPDHLRGNPPVDAKWESLLKGLLPRTSSGAD